MPNNDNDINMNKLNKSKSAVDNIMSTISRYTYYSPNEEDKAINALNKKINGSINAIVNNNMETTGVPNISKLYSRLSNTSKVKNSVGMKGKDLEEIFDNNPIIDGLEESFMQNTYLRELDDEIDSVCKYMPKLQEALDTKKDNVLCAEHFSKDFLSMKTENIDDEMLFKSRTDTLKKVYNLLTFVSDVYDNASKYGEDFIYIVPYKKAIAKLLKDKPNTALASIRMEGSTLNITEGANQVYSEKLTVLTEATSDISTTGSKSSYKQSNVFGEKERFGIDIEIDESNIIFSAVKGVESAYKKLEKITEASLFNESATNIDNVSVKADLDTPYKDKILKDTDITGNLSFDGVSDNKRKANGLDNTASDGFISSDNKLPKINVPGCVLKRLDHTQVCPVYIDDMCMGYYYLELVDGATFDTLYGLTSMISDPMVSSNYNKAGALWNNVEQDHQDQAVRYLASRLSEYIDKKFVNNNQDLRKEIYMILKSNDIFNNPITSKLRITFVPPDEMIHVYFKMDPRTHRGISDLEKALMPAKIYCANYLTNALQNMTRGYDKRVYYVKQTVETNIAKTLLNTITQIKKNDMNIRHFRSINTVLGMTGRFNDYIIPENASGESPIRMETIQGNPAQIDSDLQNALEEMAINATDVPLELIQARQSMQFATEYSMSSIKFLRKIYKRQSQYEIFLSMMVTKLYNCEYNENIDIDVILPPPVFLNLTNSTQVIENARAYVESIVNIDLGENPDPEVKRLYTKKLMDEAVGTYINIDQNKNFLNEAIMESKKNPVQDEDQMM